MSASSGRRALVQRIVAALDPSVVPEVLASFGRPSRAGLPSPAEQLVLVGHRSAGKSRLLPLVSALLERPGVDLDAELEQRHRRSLRAWVGEDVAGFRRAERELFTALPPGQVVAAGGGFLALHADLLATHLAVLVPISFDAYRERLTADTTRPRLRPELTLEEELRAIYFEREAAHLRVPTVPLGSFLRAATDRAGGG